MKNLLYLAIATLLISSCDIRKSANYDATTGISTTGDGLSTDDVHLEIEGVKKSSTSFSYGELVYIMFDNMEGFERKDGRAHVGLAVKITNTVTNKVEVSEADLFADQPDGFSETPLLVKASFLAGFPYKDNEKYKIEVKIWDKDGTGVYNMSMPFTVHESELIKVKSTQIDYSSVYFWNDTKNVVIADNKVGLKDKLLIIFDGIEGMVADNGIVHPAIALELIDDAGNVIISEANLLSDVAESGVGQDELMEQLPLTVSFGDKIVNPAHLKVIIYDRISDNELVLKSDLDVN